MKLREPVKQWLSADEQRGALNSGWTVEEIDEDLDRREKVLRQIEEKVDSFSEEKKQYLEKALDAGTRKKSRLYAKAKEADMYRSFWSELWENLMIQQFFLIKLSLEAKRRDLMANPAEELPIELDIGDLNADAIRNALENSNLEQEGVQDVIDQVDMHFDRSGDTDFSLDLDEIKSEAEEIEAAEIGSGEAELGSGMESAIDEQIDKELQKMQEEA
ncbi:hypothetical protein DVK00_19120 [Haloarcula sp. Atlit-47R]|uniref:hypothetical protein n=1 Tax=Haloarcula sp. Atlit-47R TaxID=2282132 RepID=UPI000EF294B1|nr:hypothetical protein [Haloarcula sp. Atlit-47R]RLM41950.1 hypothetical protein DVK00_19120 [Haloarcula sp. Atlit-47R]